MVQNITNQQRLNGPEYNDMENWILFEKKCDGVIMCSRDATMNRSPRIVNLSCLLHAKQLLSAFNQMGSIRKTNDNNLKQSNIRTELGIRQKLIEQQSYPITYLGTQSVRIHHAYSDNIVIMSVILQHHMFSIRNASQCSVANI